MVKIEELYDKVVREIQKVIPKNSLIADACFVYNTYKTYRIGKAYFKLSLTKNFLEFCLYHDDIINTFNEGDLEEVLYSILIHKESVFNFNSNQFLQDVLSCILNLLEENS